MSWDAGEIAWRRALSNVLSLGEDAAPRGMPTKEILHDQSVAIDMARAVVTSPARRLSYPFMAAEALWILRGDDLVEPLAKHVPRMRQFSDDGVRLAGAYGPKIVGQLDYVVRALTKDESTRQAVLTIWERNPGPSKDIPCTVAMAFSIRQGRLHQHVFMRSSDVWLGLPYDMFSFSCVGIKVACLVNAELRSLELPASGSPHVVVRPGRLTITAQSSHLYMKDKEKIDEVRGSRLGEDLPPVPDELVVQGRWGSLEHDLKMVEAGAPKGKDWQVRP